MTRYRFIEAEKAEHAVTTLCRVLKVSRAAYYSWKRTPVGVRAKADQLLVEEIGRVHRRSRGTYGSPRVHAELRAAGTRVGRKRVARLMRAKGLVGCRRRAHRRTTIPDPELGHALDLVRRAFGPGGIDRVWTSDITYVRTGEGWLYLAAIVDLGSRRVVGWAMADHLRTELASAALEMALQQRRPARGLVHHSDSEYVEAGCSWVS